ncbi:ABC-2 type transport system ATP-binding protein [Paenibacillus sp. DS2015]|uniref:ABC transporter ATP-binding protein n=1 Tax=Paenibacillus sp. DS2015 TaxID=3373917 RepID=UPI003D1B4BE2
MEQNVLNLQGVVKERRTRTIGPLDLSIPQGYVIGMVGENGAGKSSLIHMMMQLVIPDEGRIEWFGKSYQGPLPPEIRRMIGYVAEKSNVEEDNLTIEEATKFRAYWYPDWDHTLFEELITKFKIPRGTKLNKMSKGERRKFEISAAMAPHPKLLLLDEPSSGLDPFAWKMMMDVLKDYMMQGDTTILLSTHIVEEVRRLADYILLMHQGQVYGMLEKDSLMDNWKEIWVSSDADLVEDLPGVIEWHQESKGVLRMITTECLNVERALQESGIGMIKTRGLELDEILSLWIQRQMTA